MKYFLDTEFIEGFRRPLFSRRTHFIDLISIGIVAEDGRTYHAVSKEYSYREASDWVREHVLTPLYLSTVNEDYRNRYNVHDFQCIFGKSLSQIATELIIFCSHTQQRIQFIGYYSDYDWVVLCSLFGKMIDLPKGFPMYCTDVKQILDEYVSKKDRSIDGIAIPDYELEDKLKVVKTLTSYPSSKTEHSALSDACFTRDLYYWLQDHFLTEIISI